ncbi:MAG: RebB family R body protein [Caulobacteraceae bacterium]
MNQTKDPKTGDPETGLGEDREDGRAVRGPTDADADTLAVGLSAPQSMAMVDAMMGQAIGMSMLNAVAAQQRESIARASAVTMGCAAMMSIPFGSAAERSHPLPTPPSQPPPPLPANAGPQSEAAKPSAGAADPTEAQAPIQGLGAGDSRLADPVVVDPQIIDAINQSLAATMSPSVLLASGGGKAYQLVAQQAAIAVQDATEILRGLSMVATTASSVALTNYLVDGDAKYLDALNAAQGLLKSAVETYSAATAAAQTLSQFPTG